ncbi:MAG TPA: TetR family transcriptional regulator [Acidimicrobiia bacterium]|jgi:AcrR family transcriptional regulator|nr:TetR family transcriptional regulator [Acidimicrobiia bacterium]
MSARGDKTRDHLLDTAERLFAQRGIAGVSLREVRIASGARNTAAIQFHFGDREGLYQALMERHLPRIASIQQRLFDDVLEQKGTRDARALVEVLVRPTNDYLAIGPSERAWVQIMGSMASLPDLHLKEMVSAAPDAGVRTGALLYRELTREMPETLARERLIMLAQTSVHLTADHARLLEDPITSRRHLNAEAFVVNLVDMLTAALFATATVTAPRNGAKPRPAAKARRAKKATTKTA